MNVISKNYKKQKFLLSPTLQPKINAKNVFKFFNDLKQLIKNQIGHSTISNSKNMSHIF